MVNKRSSSWYVYIVRCGDDSLYTGITTDPARRVQRHNDGRGSKYVRRKGPAALVYTERCLSKSVARRRELEIQSWNRTKKRSLIVSAHRHPKMTAESATGYEFFEHTADIGIRASGTSLQELFRNMAQGLAELVAEDTRLSPDQTRPIQLKAADVELLLLAWLKELLFWFSTDRFLATEYAFESITPTALRGHVRGATFDPAIHTQGKEVKAITHHQLSVRRTKAGWQAEVIIDI